MDSKTLGCDRPDACQSRVLAMGLGLVDRAGAMPNRIGGNCADLLGPEVGVGPQVASTQRVRSKAKRFADTRCK